ncbi:hypothetical protein DIPPA_00631 [Diplonema papillatum]|nr:hypothetical protein DIPPA_00631 [Diplonema papillatum]
MKAIDVKSVLEGNTRRGIVETTTEEGRKVVAHAKELTDLEADGRHPRTTHSPWRPCLAPTGWLRR